MAREATVPTAMPRAEPSRDGHRRGPGHPRPQRAADEPHPGGDQQHPGADPGDGQRERRRSGWSGRRTSDGAPKGCAAPVEQLRPHRELPAGARLGRRPSWTLVRARHRLHLGALDREPGRVAARSRTRTVDGLVELVLDVDG